MVAITQHHRQQRHGNNKRSVRNNKRRKQQQSISSMAARHEHVGIAAASMAAMSGSDIKHKHDANKLNQRTMRARMGAASPAGAVRAGARHHDQRSGIARRAWYALVCCVPAQIGTHIRGAQAQHSALARAHSITRLKQRAHIAITSCTASATAQRAARAARQRAAWHGDES